MRNYIKGYQCVSLADPLGPPTQLSTVNSAVFAVDPEAAQQWLAFNPPGPAGGYPRVSVQPCWLLNDKVNVAFYASGALLTGLDLVLNGFAEGVHTPFRRKDIWPNSDGKRGLKGSKLQSGTTGNDAGFISFMGNLAQNMRDAGRPNDAGFVDFLLNQYEAGQLSQQDVLSMLDSHHIP